MFGPRMKTTHYVSRFVRGLTLGDCMTYALVMVAQFEC